MPPSSRAWVESLPIFADIATLPNGAKGQASHSSSGPHGSCLRAERSRSSGLYVGGPQHDLWDIKRRGTWVSSFDKKGGGLKPPRIVRLPGAAEAARLFL